MILVYNSRDHILWMWYYNDKMVLHRWSTVRDGSTSRSLYDSLTQIRQHFQDPHNEVLYDDGTP